ncbi:MAG: site-specific integrase [Chloroflexi bacterium]|nr:site-specific integrase [Chloroflexota bacterium]
MNWKPYGEFLYLRELMIIDLACHSDLSIQEIIQIRRSEIDVDDDCMFVRKIAVNSFEPLVMHDYWRIRDNMLPKSTYAFPTKNGNELLLSKFIKHLKVLLLQANVGAQFLLLNEISESTYDDLLTLRFAIQRQRYQRALAVALESHLGTRPGETSKLLKRDIDLDDFSIRFRETKSQKTQWLPIPSDLIPYFERFVRNLASNDAPLFIRANGSQWDRARVYEAVKDWGKVRGVFGATPQRLRPTVARGMKRNGASITDISKVLRHADISTTRLHYLYYDHDDIRSVVDTYKPGMPDD